MEVPSFNIDSETHVTTAIGGALSLIVAGAVFGYAVTNFHELITGADP